MTGRCRWEVSLTGNHKDARHFRFILTLFSSMPYHEAMHMSIGIMLFITLLHVLYDAKGQQDVDCPRGRCDDGSCLIKSYDVCPGQFCGGRLLRPCVGSLACLPPSRTCPGEQCSKSEVTCADGTCEYSSYACEDSSIGCSFDQQRSEDGDCVGESIPETKENNTKALTIGLCIGIPIGVVYMIFCMIRSWVISKRKQRSAGQTNEGLELDRIQNVRNTSNLQSNLPSNLPSSSDPPSYQEVISHGVSTPNRPHNTSPHVSHDLPSHLNGDLPAFNDLSSNLPSPSYSHSYPIDIDSLDPSKYFLHSVLVHESLPSNLTSDLPSNLPSPSAPPSYPEAIARLNPSQNPLHHTSLNVSDGRPSSSPSGLPSIGLPSNSASDLPLSSDPPSYGEVVTEPTFML